MNLPRTALAAALLAVTTSAAAQPGTDAFAAPAPDHGKMATEDATPAAPGAVEIEGAYSPSLVMRGSGGFDPAAHGHAHGFSLAIVYGVTEHLDVKLGGGFGYLMDLSDGAGATRGSGASDLAFGARWRFLADAERALDLAVTTSVVAPLGDDGSDASLGLTQGHWSVRNALVASKDWGRTTANADLALTVPVGGGAGDFVGRACADLAVGYGIAPWLQPFAELNYEAARDGVTAQRVAVTAGVNMTSQSGNRLLFGVQQAVWGRNVPQSTTAVVALKTTL